MKKHLAKILFLLIIFITFSLYSCELLFGYQIEGTKWSGNVLFVTMIIEFESSGIVKTASIEGAYGTVEKNQGTYTFDKQSLTGTITIDGSTSNFSINEDSDILTLSAGGISLPFQNVTKTFSWPVFSLNGKTYSGIDSDGWTLIISFSTTSSGILTYIDPSDNSSYQYNFAYTWDNENYKGNITIGITVYDYQVSMDQKYCVFNTSSDYPTYCEKQ